MRIEVLRAIAAERDPLWRSAGVEASVTISPPTEKQAAWLRLRTVSGDGELIIWESGEAELSWRSVEDLHDRHLQLDTDDDLCQAVSDLEAALGVVAR